MNQELMFLLEKKIGENTLAAQVPELFLPYIQENVHEHLE